MGPVKRLVILSFRSLNSLFVFVPSMQNGVTCGLLEGVGKDIILAVAIFFILLW